MRPLRTGCRLALPACALLLAAHFAAAQSVSLGGSMSGKALLVIDGVPRTLAAGQTHHGVKLLSAGGDQATVEIGGRRTVLEVGAAPIDLGGAATPGSGRQIVLSAGSGGHFIADGSINGRAARFMVDTGATLVALSQADAQRIGLAFQKAPRGMVQTANGQVPVHRVRLDVVRLGDVQVYGVDAVVMPVPMPHILLGNSFLTHFQMKRENDRLTLDKRP